MNLEVDIIPNLARLACPFFKSPAAFLSPLLHRLLSAQHLLLLSSNLSSKQPIRA